MVSEIDQEHTQDHIPQSTYVAVLVNAILAVVRAINAGEVEVAWRANKTLFRVLPAECKQDCMERLREVISWLNANYKGKYSNNLYLQNTLTNKKRWRYLETANDLFLDDAITSLEQRHWIIRDFNTYKGIDPNKEAESLNV